MKKLLMKILSSSKYFITHNDKLYKIYDRINVDSSKSIRTDHMREAGIYAATITFYCGKEVVKKVELTWNPEKDTIDLRGITGAIEVGISTDD